MQAVIDFETRSPADLKTRGAYVYAEHPDTQIMCLSIAIDQKRPVIWVAKQFRPKLVMADVRYELIPGNRVCDLVLNAEKIVAQNSMFEFLIWNRIARSRLKWSRLPLDKLHDTMAQLAYHALPLGLDQAAKALGLPIQKDMEGHRIMLKLSKPRKPRKAEREADPDWASGLWWHEDPADITALVNYCGQDTEAERLVHQSLAPLPAKEREIWLMSERINLRGVHVDHDNIRAIVDCVKTREAEQLERFRALTDNQVSGPRAYVALKNWVNEQTGLQVPSIDKDHTKDIFKRGDLPSRVREALEIKAELSKASVAKLQAMLNRSNSDHRFRGMAVYHGAAPGRWAARGVQPHNLPRDSYDEKSWELACRFIREKDLEALGIFFDDVYYVASRCVRGALCAEEDKELICADFSAIEGRGLAFLAGEEWVLKAYEKGLDMYKVAASSILGKSYEAITKAERQDIGKIAELACGYQGGPNAIRNFGGGEGMDDEEIYARIVNPWRDARPAITRFWYAIEHAAKSALKKPGTLHAYRGIHFAVHKGFLKCMLPSGRVLHYYRPRMGVMVFNPLRKKMIFHPEGCGCDKCCGEKPGITYMGMKTVEGKTTTQWARIQTYGGKLTENIVQGYCRDLLAEAMLRLEAAGYPIILHVHDEAAAELPVGRGNLKEFERVMSVVPTWATGMPIRAAGWVGRRYRK